jgi:hypothetical protein
MWRGDAPTPLTAASRRAVNAILPAVPLAPSSGARAQPSTTRTKDMQRVIAALRARWRPSRRDGVRVRTTIRFGTRSEIYP